MLSSVKLINLPKILDQRGNLSFFEELTHIPFVIERVYWVYDVPGGEIREGHADNNCEEFIVALSGSFDLVLNLGSETKRYSLNRSYFGLYVPNGVTRYFENFSTNSVAFVVSSNKCD